MPKSLLVVLYVVVLIGVVIGVDLPFFKNQSWERLMANIGVVLVLAAFGLRYLKDQ